MDGSAVIQRSMGRGTRGSTIQVAMSKVLFEPNLTVGDRDTAASQIMKMWDDALECRRRILDGKRSAHRGDEPRPDPGDSESVAGTLGAGRQRSLASVISAGDRVTSRMKRMRRATD